ncbi:regulatory protein RecX [Endozoicomonas sp. GU-1]|uniref:regulatory protein RecX n=1 Tax=Endozoicomonas sp. GU-1 TaxID=3009078 RepID=UPI0022B386EA|nr:regulatory protein RecX [Endozoicomonas sp. GU-1]WBA79688.1 regulatory protein RecX [Endozoicomonas sp. GU-1]WBA87272.1 regulatory protein RecX [Endozoicomonas sp. GU-1]
MSADVIQSVNDVRRAAMDLLARREHGFTELARKLSGRFPRELVLDALTRLREERLQSDDRFVESFVYSRQQRGYGPVRIKAELFQKGVDSELIGQYLLEQDDHWDELAKAVKERKFGASVPRDHKERARQTRFLAQRGFSMSQIYSAFSSS